MRTILVTSMSKKYWDVCGHEWYRTAKQYFPCDEIRIYTEDFELFDTSLPVYDICSVYGFNEAFEHAKFIESIQEGDRKTDYRYQPSRFLFKPYAMWHAGNSSSDHVNLFWFDADVVFTSVPTKTVMTQLTDCHSITYLRRNGVWPHCEGGFIGCSPATDIVGMWKQVYDSKALYKLQEWHDCMALDFVVDLLGVPVFDLSHGIKDKHPWPHSLLGTFSIHNKGQGRKQDAYGSVVREGVVLQGPAL